MVDAGVPLPPDGARIAVIGCGTSVYIAQAYTAARELAGKGEGDAIVASEFTLSRPYDAVVAISRSGTTTEVLDALAAVGDRCPRYAVTYSSTMPIAEVADHVIELPFADEESVVQTRYATTALSLLRASLGVDVRSLADQAQQVLDGPLATDPAGISQVVFLGQGAGAGLAQEAALKVRETNGAWTEAYVAPEFRHGPMSTVTDRTLVWSVGEVDPTVIEDVRRTPARIVSSGRDGQVELVAVHRYAGAAAALAGRDIDNPPFLSRSVVLR